MIQDTILIVDDEPAVLSALHRALRSEPWRIISELSAEGALVRMREQTVKVVISDERMVAKMQGIEFLSVLRARYPLTVRILLSGHVSLDAAIQAINCCEVFRVLTKPWDIDSLKQVVWNALRKYDRKLQAMRVLKRFGDHHHFFSHDEKNILGIHRVIRDKQGVMQLPVLSDHELEEVLQPIRSHQKTIAVEHPHG